MTTCLQKMGKPRWHSYVCHGFEYLFILIPGKLLLWKCFLRTDWPWTVIFLMRTFCMCNPMSLNSDWTKHCQHSINFHLLWRLSYIISHNFLIKFTYYICGLLRFYWSFLVPYFITLNRDHKRLRKKQFAFQIGKATMQLTFVMYIFRSNPYKRKWLYNR